MRVKLFSTIIVAALALTTVGCASISEDRKISSDLHKLTYSKDAAKYSAVTKRAQKAYDQGNNKRAIKLIDIVKKKVATNSTY